MKREPPIPANEYKALASKVRAKRKASAFKQKMVEINALFQIKLMGLGIAYQTEYRFEPKRRWRSDYFFPSANLALEIEGGIYTNGAHTRGKHYESDMEKYNAMTLAGIKLLRYTPDQLNQPTTINNILALCKTN